MEMPLDLKQWRKEQRAALLARRMAASADLHNRWSDTITQFLLDAFPLLQRMTVGLYWPIKGEFDPRFAIRALRDAGATAALPVVVQKAAPLEFRAWSPGVRMTRGVYDLPVPEGTAVVRPDALLIPPVGFDAQGYRLGYGGGYFDRTLVALDPQPLKIGVGFELSRMATIHPQPHDVPMDFIVTEAGVHPVTERGLVRVDHVSTIAETAERIVRDRSDIASQTEGTRGATGAQGNAPAASRYASSPFYACQPNSSDDEE
ncbi:MAG: 5-formyltetrahydrofolate cyclo-ligase [Betaproteobacteria bacterium]